MPYRIEFSPSAAREFRKAPRDVRERLRPVIDALAEVPRPPGAKALKAAGGVMRVRVGDWRILYRVEDGRLLIFPASVAKKRP